MWKLANVTQIFEKGDKQLIKNYKPIFLLPIRGKVFEKNISMQAILLPKTNQVFVQAIPHLTNYFTLLMKSIRLLGTPNP